MNIASNHSVDVQNPYGKTYQWPSSLYDELSQVGHCLDLTNLFGFIVAATHKAKESKTEFKGLEIDEDGNAKKPKKSTTNALRRIFTPSEIKRLIKENLPFMKENFAHEALVDSQLSHTLQFLDRLEAAPADATNLRPGFRPYTLESADNQSQQKEIYYSFIRDRHHKRITLVIKGINDVLECTSPKNIFSATVKMVPLPEVLKRRLEKDQRINSGDNWDENSIGLHSLFYDILFKNSGTGEKKNSKCMTLFDQIRKDVKKVLKAFPGYKVYVTGGHLLGAGLSTLVVFFLSLDKDIPKPITCINFSSPRVGTESFFKAFRFLESTCQLRMVRAVKEENVISNLPMVNYTHVGVQVVLKQNYPPDLSYPLLERDSKNCFKISFQKSSIARLKSKNDHLHCTQLLDLPVAKEFLEKYDLISIYQDEDLVGFQLVPLGVKFAIPAATTFGA